MNAERMDAIIAEMVPERLEALILALADSQAPGNREGVGLTSIVKTVLGGEELGLGAEGWERYIRLRDAIKATVSQIEGMAYVEADD